MNFKWVLGSCVILASGTIAGILLTGTGSSESACRTAMTAQYHQALSSGKQGIEPAACRGIPVATLNRIAADVMSSPSPCQAQQRLEHPSYTQAQVTALCVPNAAACAQYKSTREFLASAGTVTAATAENVTSGLQSASLLASGQLKSDLDDLLAILSSGTSAQVLTAASAVNVDCHLNG